MNLQHVFRALCIVALGAVLSSCGGDIGAIANGGISGTGSKASGVITGIGSIFVNGVEYDASAAAVSIDGNPNQPQTELKVGMVVRITGAVNADLVSGSAQDIEFENELLGPVSAAPTITASGGSLDVMGQAVSVDRATVFDNATDLQEIQQGTVVAVSGLRDAGGQVHATRLEKRDVAPAVFQARGSIGNVTATTFRLGSLTVNYGSAIAKDFPAAGLSNGLFVKVSASAAPVNGTLAAAGVTVQSDGLAAQEQDRLAVEGYVAGWSGSGFTVNGQPVTVAANTQYENGTAAALANDVRVEVEGSVVNQVLVATRVRFQLAADVELQAQVAQVDLVGQTVSLFGNPGVLVKVVANQTALQDNGAGKVHNFNLKSLKPGDWLAITGVKSGANAITATRLQRLGANSKPVTLAGRLDSAVAPTLSVLGVRADTSAAGTVFTDRTSGTTLTQAQFFGLANAGGLVKIGGTFAGAAISASTVEWWGN